MDQIVKPNYTKDYPKTRQILKLKQCEILNDFLLKLVC